MNIETTLAIVVFLVYLAADQSRFVAGSRRATTMENVRAIYNRFTRTSKGKATFYGKYPGGGLCSLDPPSPLASQTDWIKIAVSKEDFQKSLGCGMCVEIHGSGNASAPDLKGTTPVDGVLKGMVYDLCGSCKQGDVDLYLRGNGEWDITMKAIDCPSLTGTVGYIQFKFIRSNEWYFKLQPRNSKIPVAGVEVFNTVTSDWYCLKRTDDNYFTSEGLGKVTFPMKVRLTSITNEKLETTITELKNDEAFPSDVQFSGIKARGGSPEGIQCFGQGHKSTKDTGPEVDEKFCAGKADGKYDHPVDCSAYYECLKGKSYKKYCENGLRFNAMKGECDKPEKVVCPNEKRDKFSRNRIIKSIEAESMEVRYMSPRSLEEVTKKRKKSTITHKKRHHHHHYRKGLRSYQHHKHRHWINKMAKKQRRKLHLKATRTRIHQGSKRTPDKKFDVKVKVQFHGPNLSGEFVTKDPTNPKEGKLFVAAVESPEQAEQNDAQLNGQNIRNNENGQVSALVQKTNTPKSTGVPNENPFKFEDDGAADKQQNNMAGNAVVQTSGKSDGTIQTSATVKPLLNSEGNAADSQVNYANNGGLVIPGLNIQSLLKGSFQTKPKVIYLQKEADKETMNSLSLNGNLAALNVTKSQNAKKNATSNKGLPPQTIQGIMEAINLVKAIKLTRNNSNTPDTTDTSGNKSMKHEQKDHRNTTKLNNGENPNESLTPNKLLQNGGANLTNSGSKKKENSQEMINTGENPKESSLSSKPNVQNGGANLANSGSKTKENSPELNNSSKEKPTSAPNPKKQEGNFGILLIVNRTKNDNKKEQQVNPVLGNQVNIIPDIDNKMKQITDKGNEKPGNTAASNKTKQDQNADLITPVSNAYSESIPKDEQSKQDVVSKKIHHTIQKAGSVAGLLTLIGDLIKHKVDKNSSSLNETVDSSTAMTSGQDKNAEHGKVTIGKINIALQTVTQGETQENSDGESSSGTDNAKGETGSSAPKEGNSASNDLSNRLQVLERPTKQGADLKKNSGSELQEPMKVEYGGNQGNNGSIQTKPVSVSIPVMRIRLKGPASNSIGVAQMFQDEILAPESKHRGIFINNDDDESDHKGKPLHTTTVVIRQYNKDEKHANYGGEDTLPMAGSEEFDEYGNRKMAPPMISTNEADSLLDHDKSLLDNAAIHNVLYNPSLSNAYPGQNGNMKTDQQSRLTGEQEDFAHALKNQNDEPNTLQKPAAKQAESISHHVPSMNRGDRFGSFHGSRIEGNGQHGSVKTGGNQMGMEKHKNYMDELGDMPMGGDMGGMDQMQGMGENMQDMPGMGDEIQGMTGMGGGAQGMTGMGGGGQGMAGMGGKAQGMAGMGGGAQGMAGMGGGAEGMAGMGGGAQGMAGMGGGAQGMAGMGGGAQGMAGMGAGAQGTAGMAAGAPQGMGGMSAGMKGIGGTGKGSGPMGMQVLGGNQEEINSNMNQALSGMQDMAMKQMQSKYPGMPITMKADDGGEETEEEPTDSVQQESGDNQEEAGSASTEASPPSLPTTSEVSGKHQESKSNKEEKSDGKVKKISNKKGQDKVHQSENTSNKKPGKNNVAKDHNSKNSVKESDKSQDHVVNDATNNEKEGNDEPISSQNGENTKTTTGGQKQPEKSANQNADQNDQQPVSNEQTTAKLEPKDVCKQRASGVYTSNDDPSKFIICYNGITEERQCSSGMVFNPREKVCEALPENPKEKENKLQDKPSNEKIKDQKTTSTKPKKNRKISGKKSSSNEK